MTDAFPRLPTFCLPTFCLPTFRLPHGGGMSDATLRFPIDDLLAIAPPRTTASAWRPWAPPRFRPPRAGSADQSRLPSLAGDSLLYPRGLV